MNIALIVFTAFVSSTMSASLSAQQQPADYSAMADVPVDLAHFGQLLSSDTLRDTLSAEMQMCSRPAESTVVALSGGHVQPPRDEPRPVTRAELANNRLMSELTNFFGSKQKPTDVLLDNALRRALSQLDDEERALFVSVAWAGIVGALLVSSWSCVCMCIFCCGYDAVRDWSTNKCTVCVCVYVPCVSRLFYSCCWPVVGCCELSRHTCRVCARNCRGSWRRRPWRAASRV